MLLVEVDGERVLALPDVERLPGLRAAVHSRGVALPVAALTASGTHAIDDVFDRAPVRWVQGQGEWGVTSRWSCQPRWTWIVGTAHGNPILWTKRAVGGDFVLEAFVCNRMDLPGGYSHPGNLNVTVCGDGRSLSSGYTMVYGGWRNTASGFFRNGKPCVPRNAEAFIRANRDAYLQDFHRHWFHIRVERTGSRLRHLVDGELISEYDDPEPLPGGRIALWTYSRPRRGGLVVARARLWYERELDTSAPRPRAKVDPASLPWYDPPLPLPQYSKVAFTFDTPGDFQHWTGFHSLEAAKVADEHLAATFTGKDPYVIQNYMDLAPNSVSRIRIRMRLHGGQARAHLLWASDSAPAFDHHKYLSFPTICDGQFHNYTINVGSHPRWRGKRIIGLRLDPVAERPDVGSTVEIDSIVGE